MKKHKVSLSMDVNQKRTVKMDVNQTRTVGMFLYSSDMDQIQMHPQVTTKRGHNPGYHAGGGKKRD